ncbi:hypothetical protein D3C77_670660 [compost metagenome]
MAATMVDPERLRPGMSAIACVPPTINASRSDRSLSPFLPRRLRIIQSAKAVINSATPMVIIPLNVSAMASLNNAPSMPAGIVAMMRYIPILKSA